MGRAWDRGGSLMSAEFAATKPNYLTSQSPFSPGTHILTVWWSLRLAGHVTQDPLDKSPESSWLVRAGVIVVPNYTGVTFPDPLDYPTGLNGQDWMDVTTAECTITPWINSTSYESVLTWHVPDRKVKVQRTIPDVYANYWVAVCWQAYDGQGATWPATTGAVALDVLYDGNVD